MKIKDFFNVRKGCRKEGKCFFPIFMIYKIVQVKIGYFRIRKCLINENIQNN